MKKVVLFCLLLLPLWLAAQAFYTVGSVPNTRLQGDDIHISDPDGILNPEYELLINQALCGIQEQADVFVVCLNSIGDADVVDFGNELFATWGIGDAEQNNGLLMLLVMDIRKFRFEVGYGLESVMTDLACRGITENTVIPYFKKGLYAEGIYAGVRDVVAVFGGRMPNDSTLTEAQRNNLSSLIGHEDNYSANGGPDASQTNKDLFAKENGKMGLYLILYILVSIVLVVCLFMRWRKKLKVKNQTQAAVDKTNKSLKDDISLVGCLGCGFPVLWLLLPLFWLTRPLLRRQRKNCVCGHKMHRLSEAEEDKYLNEEQQFEEDLKVRDYDVWLCDACGRTSVFYYDLLNAKHYVECPLCSYQAGKKIKTETLVRATYQHGGTIQKTYLCKHCKHEFKKEERTPKLTQSPPVAGGSSSGRSSFGGGGFSGGSFGGGRSGGGGFTGSW